MKEKILKIDFDKIRYECKHINSNGKCTGTTNEEKRSWLFSCKAYKEFKPVSGFRCFKDKEKLTYLVYENDPKNYTVQIYGTGDLRYVNWITHWKKEITIINETVKKSNKDITSFADDFNRSIEITKNIQANGSLYNYGDITSKYKDYYMFVFSYGWDRLFSNKSFREQMKKKDIYNLDQYGSSKLIMFKKVFTKSTLLKTIKQYNELFTLLCSFNLKIKRTEDKFFRLGSWKKSKI